MKLDTRFSFDTVNYEEEKDLHLVVSLKAPTVELTGSRPPVYVHVVLDVSGSMEHGQKLDYAKKSISKLLEHLKPGDFIGITTFSTEVEDVALPTELTQYKRDELQSKVARIQAQQSTNFSGGMLRGLALANETKVPEGTKTRVIIFTDGQANIGVATKAAQLLPLLEANLGTTSLSAFGYGNDCDHELLGSLAQKGNGSYAFIKTPDDALTAFGKELGGLLTAYAHGIQVEVAAINGHTIQDVVSDVTSKGDDKKVTISLPDILGDEERHLVFAMKLSKQGQAFPRPVGIADVKVTYSVVSADGKSTTKVEEAKAKLTFVKATEAQEKPTPEVDKIVGSAQFVRALLDAESKANFMDYDRAREVMDKAQIDFMGRGLDAHGAAAGAASAQVGNRHAYGISAGGRSSMKAGVTRGVYAAKMDTSSEMHVQGMVGGVASPAQVDMAKQFAIGGAVAQPGPLQGQAQPVAPLVAIPAEKPKPAKSVTRQRKSW